MVGSEPFPSPDARIAGYLRRKRELMAHLRRGFVPLVQALLRDLCADLRRCRPGVADAMLVEMYFSGVGIEDETRSRCGSICRHYSDDLGLGIREHHLQLTGDDCIVTLELELQNMLSKVVTDCLGEPVPVILRVQLHSADNAAQDIELVNLEKLELADLEALNSALADYWANDVDIGTPTASISVDRSA